MIPLLIDLVDSDLEYPMAQFNCIIPDKKGMKKLIYTINSNILENPLSPQILDKIFDTYWNQFESKFNEIISTTQDVGIKEDRKVDDILLELLSTVRSFDKRLRNIESYNNEKKELGISVFSGYSGYSGKRIESFSGAKLMSEEDMRDTIREIVVFIKSIYDEISLTIESLETIVKEQLAKTKFVLTKNESSQIVHEVAKVFFDF